MNSIFENIRSGLFHTNEYFVLSDSVVMKKICNRWKTMKLDLLWQATVFPTFNSLSSCLTAWIMNYNPFSTLSIIVEKRLRHRLVVCLHPRFNNREMFLRITRNSMLRNFEFECEARVLLLLKQFGYIIAYV